MDAPAPLFRVDGGPPLPAGEARWVRSRDGDRLRAALFARPGAARGSVVLSPGRTEAIEKYGEVIGELNARGFAVLVHDWLGQGLSDRLHRDPLRGHIRGGPRRFLRGLDDVIAAFHASLPRPWMALGHSMGGGLTALKLAQGDDRFAAAVLSAPMLGVQTGAQPAGRVRLAARVMGWAGRGAGLPLPPQVPLRDPFTGNVLTHDEARFARTAALIAAHPELRLGGPTWSWLSFAFALGDALARPGAAERIAAPVSVIAAGDERLVDNAATRAFAARLPRGGYEEVAGAFHEVLMETDALRAPFWRRFDAVADEAAPAG